jgi:uncharacterized RDD family membrane protein YckC
MASIYRCGLRCIISRLLISRPYSSMIPARLTRVLGAIIYDLIIVLAIIFIAAQWFPLIPESSQHNPVITLFKQVYILGISFLYFAYSWRRGGQTIGMKPWRIRLCNQVGTQNKISWRQCAIRYLVAIISWLAAALGFIWIIFSKQHRSWHDLASGTVLVVVPKV